MPDTDETESGLWPTPQASMPGQGAPDDPKRGLKLQSAARMWPTPTKQDGENNAGPSQWERNTPPLNVAVKMWATPAKEGFDAGGHRGVKDTLYSQAGGSLNPEWVEWLMGYPIGHTDSKDSGTPSSRKSQKR